MYLVLLMSSLLSLLRPRCHLQTNPTEPSSTVATVRCIHGLFSQLLHVCAEYQDAKPFVAPFSLSVKYISFPGGSTKDIEDHLHRPI